MILKKDNVEKIVCDKVIAEKMASVGWEVIEQHKEAAQEASEEPKPKKSRKKNTDGAN